jgi:two-component system, chemotaxis family, response regulator Rcp1
MDSDFRRETPPVQILLVEDSPADVRLIREAMRESTIVHEFHVAPDGIEAMAYLWRTGPYQGAPRPQMIILDLNMPRRDGRQVLSDIKADPNLRRIPVVVMSSSGSDEDIVRAYDAHANCYIRKPIDFSQFRDVVRQIEGFWLSAARLPPS